MLVQVVNWGHEVCDPSHGYGPAVRDHYLIHYVESGEGRFVVGGESHPVKAGQGFIITPGEVTYYEASSERPWAYRWIGYTGPDARELTRQAGLEGVKVFTAGPAGELSSILRQAEEDIAAFSSPQRGEMCALGGLLRFLFKAGEQRGNSLMPAQAGSVQIYEKACWYLRANFVRHVTINETADFVGLSRSHLFRLFKAVSGIGPMEQLQQIRMARVRELLLGTSLPVKEIALSCGFSSTAYLCEIFRQAEGVTPGEYRRGKRRA